MSTQAARKPLQSARPTVQVPEGITTVSSRLRSTNLERDVLQSQLPPLYVGSRAQDTLSRIQTALEDPARTRAWSLTGPYGSGKSTLALLIDALLGADRSRREHAHQLVSAVNPELGHRLQQAQAACAPQAFTGAVTTARREPLATTLARALQTAVNRRWSRTRTPKAVSAAMSQLQEPDAGGAEIINAVQVLSESGPLLLVIDEFGKTLEHLATRGDFDDSNDDLFMLQELAERGAGPSGLPLYMLTLQHLSFLDYASHSTSLQRREWAKIQGRFEDITFTPDIADSVQLIGRSFDHSEISDSGRHAVHVQAEAASRAWSRRGLDGILPGDTQLFTALYPLHPLTAVVAPLLASQVGQHDRSLTGFVASDEPHTVCRFLTKHATPAASTATTVRLPQLYDYFLAAGRTTVLSSANASRWIEVDTRISEAHGLADDDIETLKTVGLLNLVDSSGALRASEDTVLFALSDPLDTVDDEAAREPLHQRLHSLVDRGFLVYRKFSDEFRVWQGSDVDLQARIDDIRERCDDHAVTTVLRRYLPAAVVAGRHSQRTGMLRHFVTATSEADTTEVGGPGVSDAADGVLLFHFGDPCSLPRIDSQLPTAVGTTTNAARILDAGRQVLALEDLQHDATLDAVARREVAERLGQSAAELAAVLADAFDPTTPGTEWQLIHGVADQGDSSASARLHARSLAGIVSAACDSAYPHTPEIRNEMLGRHQLTSQGAKARRELLTVMLTHPHEEHLGITGYGPERAMYSGVVAYLGLHQMAQQSTDDTHGELLAFDYAEPDPNGSLGSAWGALMDALSQAHRQTRVSSIFGLLMAPPYGVKAGVVPVVVLVALMIRHDDVAIFEEGSYQPRLGPDLMERLVKAPQRFTVKAAGTAKGQRRLVLEKLTTAMDLDGRASRRSPHRNTALLAITQVLLDYVRSISSYAKRTKRISDHALAVRSTLTEARDPDELIFSALPTALGMAAITPQERKAETAAETYVSTLTSALIEIRDLDTQLREETIEHIADAFRLPRDLATLRRDLATRARGFAEVLLEPRLKGLVTLALNDQLADADWLDPMVVRITGTPLNDWDDATAQGFPHRAQELARALDRVSNLYQVAQLNQNAQPFEAQLVTLTDSDGHEDRTLVYTPHNIQDTARNVAQTSLKEAENKLGPDGGRILLAALTQSILSVDPDDHANTESDTSSPRKEASS